MQTLFHTLSLSDYFESNKWIEKYNCLWFQGDPGLLSVPMASVVGSRNASNEGLARARKLTRLLVAKKICVVSGLAAGIDAAAHEETLKLDGKTIAVMGTPINECYPSNHCELKNRIADKGLLLSQFSPGTPVRPNNFPQRNDLMATISDLTILIEAEEKSGTRHQIKSAMKMEKPIGILSSLVEKKLTWIDEVLSYRLGFIIANTDDIEEQLQRVLSKIQATKNVAILQLANTEQTIISQNNPTNPISVQAFEDKQIIYKSNSLFRKLLNYILAIYKSLFRRPERF